MRRSALRISLTAMRSTHDASDWVLVWGEGVSASVSYDSIRLAFDFISASLLFAADWLKWAVVATLSPIKTLSVHLST